MFNNHKLEIMYGLTVLLVAGFVLLATAERFYPNGYDSNCSLNAQTMYPWVVRIWDTYLDQTVGHGSIVAYMAVLTTCAPSGNNNYLKKAENLEVIAPHVFDIQRPSTTCTQTQRVREIIQHPKCNKRNNEIDKIFNFAVLFMHKPFRLNATSFTYPVMSLLGAAKLLLLDVLYLNSRTENSFGCEVVRYADKETKAALWTEEPFFRTVNFYERETCYRQWCEESPPNVRATRMCERNIRKYEVRGTVLCVRPDKSLLVQPHPDPAKILWYAGAPFACNGTAYGHVSDFKHRAHWPIIDKNDLFLVPTFLRVWLWIRHAKEIFGANWIRELHMKDLNLQIEHFAPPSRMPITDQLLVYRNEYKPASAEGLSGVERLVMYLGLVKLSISFIIIYSV